jgi:hypothetical protein
MFDLHKSLAHAALVAVIAGSVWSVTTAPASAYIVCSRHHCWHRGHSYLAYGRYNHSYYRDDYGPAYYGPGYYGPDYYGPDYYGPGYYGPDYYGPGYYGPSISLGFGLGGYGGSHGHHH